ncbi:MAG: DODA-type extradiol aromatic ring-opening family dioxygenase, partial [bacterium]
MPDSMTQPVFYIPHGGGPCFFMDWNMGPANTWDAMADWLSTMSSTLAQKPRAILVISAHWETQVLRVTSSNHPALIYDYYGFPQHTYELKYPVPGDAEIAAKVADLLSSDDIEVIQDADRGLDHGVFIPFKLIYPAADIPIVQLS